MGIYKIQEIAYTIRRLLGFGEGAWEIMALMIYGYL